MTNEPQFDSLAVCPVPGQWQFKNVLVQRDGDGLTIDNYGGSVRVKHGLDPHDLREDLVPRVTAAVSSSGFGRGEFEAIMVGLVRTTISDPVDAWATYYRNSIDDLLSGRADFAPIHARAEQLCEGSVLDLGSCFGFFPTRLAMSGRDVIATDIHAGTVRLMEAMRQPLGIDLETLVCDARRVPVPDDHVDTVTALHLLEHLDEEAGLQVLREAMRIARRRVVVAVPFEREAQACHGHVRTFTLESLTDMGIEAGVHYDADEFHGGWLTLIL